MQAREGREKETRLPPQSSLLKCKSQSSVVVRVEERQLTLNITLRVRYEFPLTDACHFALTKRQREFRLLIFSALQLSPMCTCAHVLQLKQVT